MGKWVHKTSQNSRDIQDFVNSLKPNLDGIQGSISGGNDFHVWVRTDDKSPNSYELKCTAPWSNQSPSDIEIMLGSKEVKLLSFNVSNPPQMWFFEKV